MITIALETSSDVGSVALVENGAVLDERTFTKGLHHGITLIPTIEELLAQNRLAKSAIELIALDVGPGSYTGCRVALAAVKGLAFALTAHVKAVPSMDAIVANITDESIKRACVIIDARRKHVYAGIYERSENRPGKLQSKAGSASSRTSPSTSPLSNWVRTGGFSVILPKKLVEDLADRRAESLSGRRNTCITGSGLAQYVHVFKDFKLAPENLWTPRASTVGLLGEKRCVEQGPDDVNQIELLYLRVPEAEEKWINKSK